MHMSLSQAVGRNLHVPCSAESNFHSTLHFLSNSKTQTRPRFCFWNLRSQSLERYRTSFWRFLRTRTSFLKGRMDPKLRLIFNRRFSLVYMSLSKKPRTADNFNVLASWVQQTNHFISETQERPLDNNTSRYLSTIEELIHPDKNDARTQGSSSGTQDPTLYNDWQTGAPTSSHPENAPSDTSGVK